MLGETEVGQMPAIHAVVVIADAYGGHTDTWGVDDTGADQVSCPACGWRQVLVPGGPTVHEVSDAHLLDVAVPVLVAAEDLAEADVPAFRRRAPGYPGPLEALLAELADRPIVQQPVAQPATAGSRRPPPASQAASIGE
ncbi:hypothetical protein SAMN04488085_10457 [Geodermatophilus ruber]|uniref:Uncharacterized protein n=1 Tax=Geodermatophilus ruber TaxID=504800 RepID=A0A1I4D0E1_9ACTN|nr:hypothetical protein SAMN04488085_10457 [Geodermatophilus ruber]